MQPSTNDRVAYIHVRPGLEGKQHPVGTIAVDVWSALHEDTLRVGVSMPNLVLGDRWDAKLGREIAGGRALRSRLEGAPVVEQHLSNPRGGRRDLLLEAVVAVYDAARAGSFYVSRPFMTALVDTMLRLSRCAEDRRARDPSEAPTVPAPPSTRDTMDQAVGQAWTEDEEPSFSRRRNISLEV